MLQSAVDLDWSLTWEPLILWVVLLLLGYSLAQQHPDYRHAELMPERQAPTPSASSVSPAVPSKGKFLRQITREDWEWAVLFGVGIGLLPVVILGSFILSHDH